MITTDVYLDGHTYLGELSVRRVDGAGEDDDANYTYEARLVPADPDQLNQIALFAHRYGDPWPVLLRKALEALEEQKR